MATDKTTYAPFILLDEGEHRSLFLTDVEMARKEHVFLEREDDGWSGNGYDWGSVAQVVVAEQLSDLDGELEFDPEAGTFAAMGGRDALERLGAAMKVVFADDAKLRDLLTRAELD